jgi:enoyl-CoA hydratase/carnithine racemase
VTSLLKVGNDRDLDVVVLDSPANRNALSLELMTELLDAVTASAAGSARALVIDHAGSVFCPGVDLKERAAGHDDRHSTLFADLLRRMWDYPKPIVARVSGAARGGGMALLACCDIVVASQTSTFAYSEVLVGVAPALVLAVTAPLRPVGPLLPWMLTGTPFDAVTARALGLVHRVADEAASIDRECDALRRAAPNALRTTKRLVRQHAGASGSEGVTEMETLSAQLFRSAEAAEGMAAFRARRSPEWAPGDQMPL